MTSSARLQREADTARVELADTLGQLRDGMSASALTGEALALAKDSGLSLAKTLAEQARANPVAALLIGAGLTMLLTRTTGGDVMGAAASTMKSAASSGAEAARSAAAGVASAASGATSTVASAASAAADSVRDTAGAATDRVVGAADRVREKVSGMNDRPVSHLLEEQPILIAALGAMIGAAVGAALPLSKAEKDMIGTAGARAVDAGRNALSGAAEVLKEAAKSDIGGKVSELADKVVEGATRDIGRPG